jgi:hypothetical protein
MQWCIELNPMPGDKTDLHTRRNLASITPKRYLAKQLDFLLFYEIAHTIPSSFKYRSLENSWLYKRRNETGVRRDKDREGSTTAERRIK